MMTVDVHEKSDSSKNDAHRTVSITKVIREDATELEANKDVPH